MHLPDGRTRAFLAIIGAWCVAFGAVTRLRIYRDVPLPPRNPLLWLADGAMQDAAVVGAAVLLVALLFPWPRIQRWLFGAFAFATAILAVVRSEAVVFFGDIVRPEDLHGDIPVHVAVQSLVGTPLVLFITAFVTFIASVIVALRVGRQHHLSWMRPIPIATSSVVAAAIAILLNSNLASAGLARNPLLSLFGIEEQLMQPPTQREHFDKPSVPITTIRDLIPSQPPRAYLSDALPLAYTPAPSELQYALPVKPNIVIVLMESVRAEEVGCYGADPPGVTPNLDALAANGIRVEDAYSPGTYTSSAEIAIWYGLPPIPREILMTSRPEVKMTGLPELLRANGWKSLVWIHGGDSNFYRRDAFYIPRGFRIVDARSFPTDDPSTNWGYSDRAMVRHAVRVFDHTQQPFAGMMLTLTNHHPFTLPSDAGPQFPLQQQAEVRTAGLIQTIHYTDEAVGDFMRLARTKPWFKNTIFIFAGDHGLTTRPLAHAVRSQHEMINLRQRVPIIIYSPLLQGGRVIHGPASQLDLMPTLLALCGIRTPWTGMGSNLFDLPEDRVIPLWNTHGRVLTLASGDLVYHAAFGSDANPSRITNEKLFETHDTAGAHDIAAEHPDAMQRFRQETKTYMRVFPWLVVNGKSGAPL